MAIETAPDTEAPRVLVVDDEPNIVDVISMALRFQGFDVESAGDRRARRSPPSAAFQPAPDRARRDAARHGGLRGRRAARRAARARPDHLPHRARRDRGQDPRPHDRRRRLRHQAVQPRGAGRAHPHDPAPHRRGARPSPAGSCFEDLELDEDTREVTRAGEPIELTATEYRLLRYLMLNPRRVLTRAQILDHVWDYDFGGDARVLETYVSYLRKKLDVARPAADPHRARRRLRAARRRGADVSLRARLVAGLLVARRARAGRCSPRSPTPSSARSCSTASTQQARARAPGGRARASTRT